MIMEVRKSRVAGYRERLESGDSNMDVRGAIEVRCPEVVAHLAIGQRFRGGEDTMSLIQDRMIDGAWPRVRPCS
jgi:hypothetical protein